MEPEHESPEAERRSTEWVSIRGAAVKGGTDSSTTSPVLDFSECSEWENFSFFAGPADANPVTTL